MKVAISKGEEAFNTTLKSLELIKDDIEKSLENKKPKRILVKPNLVFGGRNDAANTDVNVVRAVITFLNSYGKFKIVVGEGSFGSTENAFRQHGYYDLEEEFDNVKLIDFDTTPSGKYLKVRTLDGEKEVDISTLLKELDYIVSVAKLKVHNQVIVTFSLKNMMGFVKKGHKVFMHGGLDPGSIHLSNDMFERESYLLNHNLVRLSNLIYPDLAVIDGMIAMEGEGPGVGDAVKAGVIIASGDPLCADLVATQVLGEDVNNVGYLRYLKEKRIQRLRLSEKTSIL